MPWESLEGWFYLEMVSFHKGHRPHGCPARNACALKPSNGWESEGAQERRQRDLGAGTLLSFPGAGRRDCKRVCHQLQTANHCRCMCIFHFIIFLFLRLYRVLWASRCVNIYWGSRNLICKIIRHGFIYLWSHESQEIPVFLDRLSNVVQNIIISFLVFDTNSKSAVFCCPRMFERFVYLLGS